MPRPKGSDSGPRVQAGKPASQVTPEGCGEVLTKVGSVYWLVSLSINGRRVSADVALRHALKNRTPLAVFTSLADYAARRRVSPDDRLPAQTVTAPDSSGALLSTMGDVDAGVVR